MVKEALRLITMVIESSTTRIFIAMEASSWCASFRILQPGAQLRLFRTPESEAQSIHRRHL
jgi:hypothetical protein